MKLSDKYSCLEETAREQQLKKEAQANEVTICPVCNRIVKLKAINSHLKSKRCKRSVTTLNKNEKQLILDIPPNVKFITVKYRLE